MPKEWTHWMIASQALKANMNESAFSAAAECPAAYYLGAVAHDSPYYSGPDMKIVGISNALHSSSDTFSPILKILDSFPDSVPARAFACGALSHIATDTIFHPAVFYFTGSSTHPDESVRSSYMFSHWAFETAMDRFFSADYKLPMERGFGKLLQKAFNHHWSAELIRAIGAFYGIPGTCENIIKKILLKHAWAQRKLTLKFWYLLATLITLPVRHKNSDVRSAFYFYNRKLDSWFDTKRDYKHPVTGETAVFDAKGFFAQAVEKSAVLIRTFYKADLSENNRYFPGPGPCLDSNLLGSDERPMIYLDRTFFKP